MAETSCARQRPLHHVVVPLPRKRVRMCASSSSPVETGEGDLKGGGGAVAAPGAL